VCETPGHACISRSISRSLEREIFLQSAAVYSSSREARKTCSDLSPYAYSTQLELEGVRKESRVRKKKNTLARTMEAEFYVLLQNREVMLTSLMCSIGNQWQKVGKRVCPFSRRVNFHAMLEPLF
jgi:hypothetical protein